MQIYQATQKGPLKMAGFLDPDDRTKISVSWGADVWLPNTVYRNGDICRPTNDNGYYYQCSTNGVSGTTEPLWDQEETVSGTVTFTAVPWDLWVLPLESITASVWSATDGVSVNTLEFSDTTTTATINPFANTINQIEITNQITKSTGEKLSRSFLYKTNQQ